MVRQLTADIAEFSPPTSVSVVFSETEIYTFKKVVKASKSAVGGLHLELEGGGFAEVVPPFHFFQVGGDVESD